MMLKRSQILDIGRAVIALSAAVFFGFYASGQMGAKAFGDATLALTLITLYDGRKTFFHSRLEPRRRGIAFWTMCFGIFIAIAFVIHALRGNHPNFGIGILLALLAGTASVLLLRRAIRG